LSISVYLLSISTSTGKLILSVPNASARIQQ
jgi:hypothetical protein